MVKVDSKGRILLPQDVRDSLGLTPGTEVEVRKEGGNAVIEPRDDPDQIIERMNELISEASENRESSSPLRNYIHRLAKKHDEIVRR